VFRRPASLIALLALLFALQAPAEEAREPIAIGETFTLHSEVLDETRRINVFEPTKYGEAAEKPLPVLYMLDGGIDEDFLHVAGLMQVFVSNGSMGPFLLVGIENTDRQRDMTGPSEDPEDLAMAETIGGANSFRTFIREELFAEIERRYEVSSERALMGESLAGLFVVETLLEAPEMFETYVAADPSVWWNRYALNETAAGRLASEAAEGRRLFLAASREASGAERFRTFVDELGRPEVRIQLVYSPMPDESHATLFHPAAMKAFRTFFAAGDGH
jgi:hypothetical protein